MDNFQITDKFLFIGQSGCGKSYLARKLQYPRCVIFDTLHEYDDETLIAQNFEHFTQLVLSLQRENKSEFRLVYQFDPESGVNEAEFNQALRVLYYRGDCQIVIEEVQNFSTTHALPHWLRQCFLTGRHRNISLQMTTQRPGELNKTLLSQCRHAFFGQLFEKNDIEYCRAVLGQRAYELASLKPREFLYFSPGQPTKKITNDLKTLDQKSPESKKDLDLNLEDADHNNDADETNDLGE